MTGEKRSMKRQGLELAAIGIFLGFVACLSEEDDGTGSTRQAVIPTLPSGEIIDTEANSGWTEGSFSVSEDGAAVYDVPIAVPDGRRGLQPSLALHYNSQGGNGLVGVGWSLQGLSTIGPCPRTKAQDNENRNVTFGNGDVYCLDGARLRPIGNPSPLETEYRTERDGFARIISNHGLSLVPISFKVWMRDGRVMTYGASLAATKLIGVQPETPAFQQNGTATLTWALSRIEDRNGNKIDVAYETIPGTSANRWATEFVPKEITYEPGRKVEFLYASRTDMIDGFQSGTLGAIHTRMSRKLTKIRVWTGSVLFREYQFGYSTASITGRSLLTSITECDGLLVCLNPVQFEWSNGGFGFHDPINTSIADVGTDEAQGYSYTPGDINGDGKDDLFYARSDGSYRYRLSTGGAFDASQNPGFTFPAGRVPIIRSLDYNRDGMMDVMAEVGNAGSSRLRLYSSSGTTFTPYATEPFDPVVVGGSAGQLANAYLLDINGDGLVDYVASIYDGDSHRWRLRLSQGSDSFASLVDTQLRTLRSPDTKVMTKAISLDGMRSADLVVYDKIGGVDKYTALEYTSQLVKENAATHLNLPFLKRPENTDRRNLQLADINGDGLQDAIYPLSGLAVQLNGGAGFSDLIAGPSDYANPAVLPSEQRDIPVRVVDFDGDGAQDVLILHPGTPSNANDFAKGMQLYSWRGVSFVRVSLGRSPVHSGFPHTEAVQPLDFDGDGAMDLAQVWTATDASGAFLRLLKRRGGVPDKLIRVKVAGLGPANASVVRAEVDYTTLADRAVFAPCTTEPLSFTICPRRGGSLVAKHRLATGDSQTPWNEFTHTYAGARVDSRGRGWLGMEQHAVSTLNGAKSVTTTFDNITIGFWLDSFNRYFYPFAGMPSTIKHTVTENDGLKYEHTRTYDYDFLTRQTEIYSVVVTSTTESDREKPSEGSWAGLHSRTSTYSSYDLFNNPRTITTVIPGSDRTSMLTYVNDTTNWLIGQLQTTTMTDCLRPSNECATRKSKREHEATTGNLAAIEIEPDDPSDPTFYSRTTFMYGTNGNLTEMKTVDAEGVERNAVTLTYDTLNLYPKTATNGLGHMSEVVIDPGLGVVLESRDPNRIPVTNRYDRYGRMREVHYADGHSEQFSHAGPLVMITSATTDVGVTKEVGRITLDVLGRPIERRALAFDGTDSAQTTHYDSLGRVDSVSRPFTVGSSSAPVTTFTYDLRNRLKSAAAPDGATVGHIYAGLRTDTYDAKGNQSYVVMRSDGRLDARYEDDPKSPNWLETSFEYAPFGLIKTISSADGAIRSMQYDKLGRAVEETDPNSGLTTTTYNAFGEVEQVTNALNEATIFDYDVLGRPKSTSMPEGQTVYTWDPVNQKGHVASVSAPDGVATTYSYDEIGRNTEMAWTVEGVNYATAIDYDEIGRPEMLLYPELPGGQNVRTQVMYIYNPSGYLEQIQDAASGVPYWRASRRNAAGQLELETYGQNVTATRTYSPTTGLLTDMRVDGPTGQLDGFQYGYDLNRNVVRRQDQIGTSAKTQTYTYDVLNRLTSWKLTGGSTNMATVVTYDYSSMGDLLSETTVTLPESSGRCQGTFVCECGTPVCVDGEWQCVGCGEEGIRVTYGYGLNGAPPHAVTSRDDGSQSDVAPSAVVSYTYDALGRQRTGPGRALTYNSLNLPRTLTRSNGETTSYIYDDGGGRVLKRDAQETTITIAGLFERRVPSVAGAAVSNIHYIAADGRVVAQINRTQSSPTGPVVNTATRYLMADLQRNVTQTINANGSVAEEHFYEPFGRRTDREYTPLAAQRRATRLGYTSHEHEDELDLINMRGRIYDPVTRHFLTPDPIVHPLLGQSHNRYGYVLNNPATLTDPSGLCATPFLDDCPATHDEAEGLPRDPGRFGPGWGSWGSGGTAGDGYSRPETVVPCRDPNGCGPVGGGTPLPPGGRDPSNPGSADETPGTNPSNGPINSGVTYGSDGGPYHGGLLDEIYAEAATRLCQYGRDAECYNNVLEDMYAGKHLRLYLGGMLAADLWIGYIQVTGREPPYYDPATGVTRPGPEVASEELGPFGRGPSGPPPPPSKPIVNLDAWRTGVPTTNERITGPEQQLINALGDKHGCWTPGCNATTPGTKPQPGRLQGNWVGDHQLPKSVSKGPWYLVPHCKSCSSRQGRYLARLARWFGRGRGGGSGE